MNCETLALEYELAFSTYEGFNDQFLAIKGWSVSVGLAGILASYSDALKNNAIVAMSAASLSVIPFWIMDAQWKAYQSNYVEKIESIEAIDVCSKDAAQSFSLFSGWGNTYSEFAWVGHLFQANVAFPHAFILVLGMVLAWKKYSEKATGT